MESLTLTDTCSCVVIRAAAVATDHVDATVTKYENQNTELSSSSMDLQEHTPIKGHFTVEILDAAGALKERIEDTNTVMTAGKNGLLNTWFAGSSYTTTGPYMGLISSSSYSAISASDTMSSHSGWLEAGGSNAPTYSGSRATMSMASASGGSISLSSAASFSITGSGTIEGVFVCMGSGASATIANTGGTLFSAGTFTGGAVTVSNGDTVNVSYTFSI